jgi:hypothetical protein
MSERHREICKHCGKEILWSNWTDNWDHIDPMRLIEHEPEPISPGEPS